MSLWVGCLNVGTADSLDRVLLCCGAVQGTVGSLAASQASTHQMPVASFELWQPKMTLDIDKFSWGWGGVGRIAPSCESWFCGFKWSLWYPCNPSNLCQLSFSQLMKDGLPFVFHGPALPVYSGFKSVRSNWFSVYLFQRKFGLSRTCESGYHIHLHQVLSDEYFRNSWQEEHT